MVKIILNGCNGIMGQVITQLTKSDEGLNIVAGVIHTMMVTTSIRFILPWKLAKERQMLLLTLVMLPA